MEWRKNNCWNTNQHLSPISAVWLDWNNISNSSKELRYQNWTYEKKNNLKQNMKKILVRCPIFWSSNFWLPRSLWARTMIFCINCWIILLTHEEKRVGFVSTIIGPPKRMIILRTKMTSLIGSICGKTMQSGSVILLAHLLKNNLKLNTGI